MEPAKIIAWQAPDHDLHEKAVDWYLSVVAIGTSVAVASFFLNNFIFAIFCILATISIVIHAAKKPEMIDFAITTQGLQIKHDFFPYDTLHSFWINHKKNKGEIIIHSDRAVLPHLIIPIGEMDQEHLRIELRRHIPERYEHKNLFDFALEYLGF